METKSSYGCGKEPTMRHCGIDVHLKTKAMAVVETADGRALEVETAEGERKLLPCDKVLASPPCASRAPRSNPSCTRKPLPSGA